MNGSGKKTEIQLRLIKIGYWGIYLDPGGMKLQCTGGYCTLKRLMICTAWKMSFRWSYQEEQCLLSCGMDEVGAYSGFWWGTNHLKVLGCYDRIKLNGSARNASSWTRMIFFLDGDLCQALVKTIVNHWDAWNVLNWLTNWRSVWFSWKIVLFGISDYFV